MSLENPENPNFLKKKYDLHHRPEVESAAERTAKRTDRFVFRLRPVKTAPGAAHGVGA